MRLSFCLCRDSVSLRLAVDLDPVIDDADLASRFAERVFVAVDRQDVVCQLDLVSSVGALVGVGRGSGNIIPVTSRGPPKGFFPDVSTTIKVWEPIVIFPSAGGRLHPARTKKKVRQVANKIRVFMIGFLG